MVKREDFDALVERLNKVEEVANQKIEMAKQAAIEEEDEEDMEDEEEQVRAWTTP